MIIDSVIPHEMYAENMGGAEKMGDILFQQISPSQLGQAQQLAVKQQCRIDHPREVPGRKTH